ncbi:hypothetical protein ABXS75_08280 [Roseburia hominis]
MGYMGIHGRKRSNAPFLQELRGFFGNLISEKYFVKIHKYAILKLSGIIGYVYIYLINEGK